MRSTIWKKSEVEAGGAAEKKIRRSVIFKVTQLQQTIDKIVGLDTQANCSLVNNFDLVESFAGQS